MISGVRARGQFSLTDGTDSQGNRADYLLTKKIIFSASGDLIKRAPLVAKSQRTTLNDAFRERLLEYTRRPVDVREFDAPNWDASVT